MFRTITNFCAWLDTWLETNVGRPYNTILSVGLVLEMINKIQSLPQMWSRNHSVVGALFSLAVEGALLINQLGEFSHRRHKRVARKAAKAGVAPEGDHPHPPILEPPRFVGLLRRLRRRP